MARAKPTLAAGVALIGLGVALPAEAYEPRESHRWLTRMAAEHLVRAYPGEYDELEQYIDTVAEGAEHEDNLFLGGDLETLRVMRHFYRPSDGAGLYLEDRGSYRSSLEWAQHNDTNSWNWENGLRAYAEGDRNEAYFVLGHIVHLVQDLTVPAHTHLDEHPPPAGDDYEIYVAENTFGEYEANLPTPPANAPVPAFDDLEDAWLRTASASYYRNLYPGDLTSDDAPAGVIADMFPDIDTHWFGGEWHIDEPPVGTLGDGFFESASYADHYYFKTTAYPAAVDRAEFDPQAPRDLSVIAENSEDAPMAELLARDLIPIAILHSAGVMKLYLDEAYARAPDEAPGDGEAVPGPGGARGCAASPAGSPLGSWLLVLSVIPLMWCRRLR